MCCLYFRVAIRSQTWRSTARWNQSLARGYRGEAGLIYEFTLAAKSLPYKKLTLPLNFRPKYPLWAMGVRNSSTTRWMVPSFCFQWWRAVRCKNAAFEKIVFCMLYKGQTRWGRWTLLALTVWSRKYCHCHLWFALQSPQFVLCRLGLPLVNSPLFTPDRNSFSIYCEVSRRLTFSMLCYSLQLDE